MMSRKQAAVRWLLRVSAMLISLIYSLPALAQHAADSAMGADGSGGAASTPAHHGGGEANLVVPPLGDVSVAHFMGNMSGSSLLTGGILVSLLGMAFALMIYSQLKN